MLVRLLGPIGVFAAGEQFRLNGQKERTALAALAAAGGQPVHGDRLIAALWGDSPPRTAAKTLQTYIARLRATLGDVIESTSAGYVLRADVDVALVERLAADARAAYASGDFAGAAGDLAAALEQWSGQSLADAAETLWAMAERTRLEELRLALAEERVDALLACGQSSPLVPDLESMVAEAPLRERRWGQLMLALYRSGRQGEALRVYQRLRTTLAEELGIDPSLELRTVQRQVLDQDPALQLAARAQAEPTSAGRLPSGVVTFLLIDVEESTALWERSATIMERVGLRHDALVTDSIHANAGQLLSTKGEGDSTLSVFVRASDAVAAAVTCQQRLAAEAWPEFTVSVRAAVVTGEAVERDGGYKCSAVNRAARLRDLANGGDVLLAHSTVDVVSDHLPEGVRLEDLGERALPGFTRSEHVWRMIVADDEAMSSGRRRAAPANVQLPAVLEVASLRPLIGREGELARLSHFIEGDGRRLVWVRGEAGVGKTRLVAELARRARSSGAIVLYGRCDEGLGAPYQPFVEALRHWVANVPRSEVLAASTHRAGTSGQADPRGCGRPRPPVRRP